MEHELETGLTWWLWLFLGGFIHWVLLKMCQKEVTASSLRSSQLLVIETELRPTPESPAPQAWLPIIYHVHHCYHHVYGNQASIFEHHQCCKGAHESFCFGLQAAFRGWLWTVRATLNPKPLTLNPKPQTLYPIP